MDWSREPYLDYMTGRRVGRPIVVELFGPLVGLEEQWRAQGATPDELSLDAFEWDTVRTCNCGGNCTAFGLPAAVTIEETHEVRIQRDGYGRISTLYKRNASLPLPTTFPVRNMDDWLALKGHFQWHPDRIDPAAIERAQASRADGCMIQAFILGAFDTARELMGEENACLGYYDQPELMHDIIRTLHEMSMQTLDFVSREVTIDRLEVHEDFAGRSGPLVGPSQIREFFQQYYRGVWDMLADRGATLFGIDTDGNINAVIEALQDCGLNELYPMEPAAGMDIVQTRRQYGPDLKLRGGIDKFIVRNGNAADIRREIEYKCQPAMRTGGIVFGLDHRIPDGTPLQNYRCYVDTLREVLGLPARTGPTPWRRTA